MLLKLVVLIVLKCIFVRAYQNYQQSDGAEVGDACTVSRTGQGGKCKLITACQPVIDDIRRKRFPTVCGYEGRHQIVCCPNPPTTPPPTKPTTPLRLARISVQKCDEYKNAVYEKQLINSPFNDMPIEKLVSTCAFSTVPLIVGGTNAMAREFPHMVLVGYENGDSTIWGCGASLISDQYALTAGHCLHSRDYGPAKFAKLGDLVLNTDSDDTEPIDVPIADVIKHPNYRKSSNYDDIGLLRFIRKIILNRYIRPACLHDSFETDTRRAIATGWGQVEWNGRKSDPLLKVILELFTYQECNQTFQYDKNRRLRDGIVESTQLCAGSHSDNKDTCQGDSGGPLQIYHKYHSCMYSVVGVTSFGKACGLAGNPGVYTRVYAYLDWIESVVWPEE